MESLLVIVLAAADDLVNGAPGTARLQIAPDRLAIAAKIALGEPVSEADVDRLYLRKRGEDAAPTTEAGVGS